MSASDLYSAAKLADYLADIRPALIVDATLSARIGRRTYVGVHWHEVCSHDPGTMAYQRGERSYVRESVTLLGDLPPSYINGHGRAGYVAGDGSRWFIGSWWEGSAARERIESSPIAHVLEPDGSTRPQTFADVAPYHYGAGEIAYFQLMPGTPTNRYGAPYSVAPMPITITED